MAGKIFFILLLIGGLFWAYQNDILDSLSSKNRPKIGKAVKLRGPFNKEAVPVAADLNRIGRVIDARLGSGSDKLNGAIELASLYKNGDVIKVPENTQAEVAGVSSVKLHGVPFPVVKVKLLSGSNKGGIGWVDRENVIDTPMHDFFHSIKAGSASGENKRRGDIGGALMPLSTGD